MSRRTLSIDDRLYQYILDASLREHPMLAELRAATRDHRQANMQISPEQGQLLALLVKLIGARRTIEVRTEGFEHNFGEVFEDKDPVSDVFLADLDDNGFDEIYIITTAAGSGSYGGVLGFASNKDKSLSMINFPEMREGDPDFEGYMGHDSFKIEDQKLVRIFPTYKPGDTHSNPTGGRRKLVYGLVPGEAMWQLRVEQSEMLDDK